MRPLHAEQMSFVMRYKMLSDAMGCYKVLYDDVRC